jgi:transposase
VDVPPKLSVRARVFATGQGRKTDATDAHSVALVGTRMAGLRPVVADEQRTVLRLLVDRRRSLGEEHTGKIAQLHALLRELVPGGAKVFLSAAQAKTILAGVRPRDLAGKTRKRVAAELVRDLQRIPAQQGRRQGASGSAGCDRDIVAEAARHRPDRRRVAARRGRGRHPLPGPQPLRVLERQRTDRASSGDVVRHRRSRAGNRQINRVLHTMAIVQLRTPTHGRAYYDRKTASGKGSMEAMRCLQPRLSDIVFRTMLADLAAASVTGPGGQPGDDSHSSAAGPRPHTGTSDKPLPGPATTKTTTALAATG